MYQRFSMARAPLTFIDAAALSAKAEERAYDPAEELVGGQEKQAGERHENEHHHRGNGGLAPRGPNDLRDLRADLLEECKWIGSGGHLCSRLTARGQRQLPARPVWK